MRDWLHIVHRAWSDSLDFMGGGTLITAVGVFFISVFLARLARRRDTAKDWSFNGKVGFWATVIFGVIVFLAYVLFISPVTVYREERAITNNQSNTIWVSSSNSLADFDTGTILGNGSFLTPYYGDYDAIINSQPTNTLFHLLPGAYSTRGNAWNAGDPWLLTGDRLMGAGIDTTIVRRNPSYYNETTPEVRTIGSASDNIQVSDLTVDCQGSNTYTNKYEGIHMYGNMCTVRDVKIIKASGNWFFGNECFAIFMNFTNASATYGDLVENCVLTNFYGSYDDGIQASGDTVVMNNHVYMTPMTNYAQLYPPTKNIHNFSVGINFAEANGVKILHNYVQDGLCSVYVDTGNISNILISGNSLVNGFFGINVGCGAVDTISIVNNTIDLNTNDFDYRRSGIFIYNGNAGYSPYDKILVAGNTVKYWNNFPTSPQANQYSIDIHGNPITTNIVGVRVIGNAVDSTLLNYVSGLGVWMADNVDLNGNYLTNLNNNVPNVSQDIYGATQIPTNK